MQKYYLTDSNIAATESSVALWIIRRLVKESGAYFALEQVGAQFELRCSLTNELLQYSSEGELFAPLRYRSLFDAVASQLQEDLAIVVMPEKKDRTIALHLCAPNHWSPESKIGKTFVEIHQPIAEIEKVNASASQLVRGMILKGPFERFAWGISDDTVLNHHPSPPPGISSGRNFDGHVKDLFLRIERQTTHGFPELDAALFTIRTYFLPCAELSKDELTSLSSALHSMTPASRLYKGIARRFDEIQRAITRLQRAC